MSTVHEAVVSITNDIGKLSRDARNSLQALEYILKTVRLPDDVVMRVSMILDQE